MYIYDIITKFITDDKIFLEIISIVPVFQPHMYLVQIWKFFLQISTDCVYFLSKWYLPHLPETQDTCPEIMVDIRVHSTVIYFRSTDKYKSWPALCQLKIVTKAPLTSIIGHKPPWYLSLHGGLSPFIPKRVKYTSVQAYSKYLLC